MRKNCKLEGARQINGVALKNERNPVGLIVYLYSAAFLTGTLFCTINPVICLFNSPLAINSILP